MAGAPNHLDLVTYASNYKGHLKIDRLVFIAERCPSLQTEAYRLAIKEIQDNTKNTSRYIQLLKKLNHALEAKGQPTLDTDTEWVERTQRDVKRTYESLESELKNHRTNLIKDSIRVSQIELGNHQYTCGDIQGAIKSYVRAREYCSSTKHSIEVSLYMIRANHELNNLPQVLSHITKAESSAEGQKAPEVQVKLHASQAIVQLDGGKFRQAAQNLVTLNFEELQKAEYNDVLAPNDVAIYGGLCALALFSRRELKTQVLDNENFKHYLELEPQIREIIQALYRAKYADCLELLDSWRNDFALDMYLHSHVEVLYTNIKQRLLKQYVQPFRSVSLHRMAEAFGRHYTLDRLQKELVDLISSDQLPARIDDEKKVLSTYQEDARSEMYTNAFQIADIYERQTKAMLVRMLLVYHDLHISNDGRH